MSQYTDQDLELAQDVVQKLRDYDRATFTHYAYYLDEGGAQVLAQVFSDLGVAKVQQPGYPSFSAEVQ